MYISKGTEITILHFAITTCNIVYVFFQPSTFPFLFHLKVFLNNLSFILYLLFVVSLFQDTERCSGFTQQ